MMASRGVIRDELYILPITNTMARKKNKQKCILYKKRSTHGKLSSRAIMIKSDNFPIKNDFRALSQMYKIDNRE